jgi:hypothetical protein
MWREHSSLRQELERHIHLRTGRRVRDLSVEIEPERVVLRGRAGSYYVKQLAQHGALEIVSHLPLSNTIVVEDSPPPR